MHADGPRAVGPHGKAVEASAGTTASDVGDIWKSVSKNLNPFPPLLVYTLAGSGATPC